MQVQPFLLLCLTQDFKSFILAAVLRPRTGERGCTLRDRNSFPVELYSQVGITGKTIPVERRDSVRAEVQHHVMNSSLLCPAGMAGCWGRKHQLPVPAAPWQPPSAALSRLSQLRTQTRGVPGSPSRGVPTPGVPQHEELSSPCLYSQV